MILKPAVKISIALSVFILIVLTGSLVFIRIYEKDIKQFAVNELNKKLNTRLYVSSIELSVLRKFPFASLHFTDVLAKDPFDPSGSDTLFYCRSGWLKFNLFDIIRKDYRIKRIELDKGLVNLRINKDGESNYNIFKTSEEKSEFFLEIDRITASAVRIRFDNALNRDHLDMMADDLSLKGSFSKQLYSMVVSSSFMANTLVLGGMQYVDARHIELNTELKIDKTKNTYTFNKGEITFDHAMHFGLSGNMAAGGEEHQLDLVIYGKDLSVTPALRLLPDAYRSYVDRYRGSGMISFQCRISGHAGVSATPSIMLDFNLSNGSMEYIPTGSRLDSLHLSGSYSNGKTQNSRSSLIEINELSAKFEESRFHASCSINNLDDPFVHLSVQGVFSLSELLSFAGIDSLGQASGKLKINAAFKGKVGQLSHINASLISKGNISGFLVFDSLTLQLPGNHVQWKQCSGSLQLHNNDVLIRSLQGRAANSDFRMQGLFRNMIPYFLEKNETLTIEAMLSSPDLDMDSLLANHDGRNAQSYMFSLPENIRVNLKLRIARMHFRSFLASSVQGIVQMDDNGLRVQPVSIQAMDGGMEGLCQIKPLPDKRFMITARLKASGVDVRKLFIQFENFGQQVITGNNLRGKADALIDFRCPMDSGMIIRPAEVKVSADVEISKGELIRFEPMNDIAGYFRENKILSTLVKPDVLKTKLSHIYFSKLSNHIEIQNSLISIPDMQINSSALDLEIYGTHTFDNLVDYGLNFYFTDLIAKKDKHRKEHFGYVKDDGLGKTRIFLHMSGPLDDPVIRWDKKEMLAHFKKKNQEEKRELKSILNEEFGWFKKDTALLQQKQQEKAEFLIEWDEALPGMPDSLPGDSARQNRRKDFYPFVKHWNKKNHPDDEEEMDFGDDDY